VNANPAGPADTDTATRGAAETARSILACPAAVDLVIDGVADPVADDARLGLLDLDGAPTFSCRVGGTLSRAAAQGRGCVLTLASGLGPAGSPDRDAFVALAGRLRRTGVDQCDCCEELRDLVAVDLDSIRLSQAGTRIAISVADFAAGEHMLNRGYLQRATEHANDAHQSQLRQAIASRLDRRADDILAVSLASLTSRGVEVRWVDGAGGHRTVLRFPYAATTPRQLGDLLRRQLHPRLC
jgi:hypothetical protein